VKINRVALDERPQGLGVQSANLSTMKKTGEIKNFMEAKAK